MQHLTVRHLADPTRSPADLTDSYIDLPQAGLSDESLAQAIYLSGLVPPPALCSGVGRCGRCRVRFLSTPPPALPKEYEVLSEHDIENNWRLACLHAPASGMHVQLPPPSPYGGRQGRMPGAGASGHAPAAPKPSLVAAGPAPTPLTLAVDLGTTSLHWQAGPAGGAMINPQMGAGSEVMSRLACAATPEGAAALRRLTLNALKGICAGLDEGVREICLAANPAMTAITLGKDCSGLARAPYRLDYAGGAYEQLPGLPPVWTAPQVSPFIGGDISAGYAALTCGAAGVDPIYPFLFADLGTNGECLLALSPQQTLAASVPMGPALEGLNLTFGTEARPGAVTGYSLTPLGLEPQVLDDTAPTGVTATGYLSLIQNLRKAGLVGVDGLFSQAAPMAKRLDLTEKRQLRLPGRMFLDAADVEEILKVKAAFSLAVSRLLHAAGLPPSRLTALYLGGSLGLHAPADALEDLGFIPPGFAARVRAIGNSSLAGARLFLDRPETRDPIIAWTQSVTTLDLANDPAFSAAYADHMSFAWR